MINDNNLINDGLDINSDGSCTNNGDTVWSYNQGVVLGGLVELSKATGDSEYLSEATSIAEAAIEALSEDGILHESCEPNDCGGDGSQFKGEQITFAHKNIVWVTRADLDCQVYSCGTYTIYNSRPRKIISAVSSWITRIRYGTTTVTAATSWASYGLVRLRQADSLTQARKARH